MCVCVSWDVASQVFTHDRVVGFWLYKYLCVTHVPVGDAKQVHWFAKLDLPGDISQVYEYPPCDDQKKKKKKPMPWGWLPSGTQQRG